MKNCDSFLILVDISLKNIKCFPMMSIPIISLNCNIYKSHAKELLLSETKSS